MGNDGREIDAKVAMGIMGWKDCLPDGTGIPPGESGMREYPHYSTDEKDALLVVEEMKSRGFTLQSENTQGGVKATFFKH